MVGLTSDSSRQILTVDDINVTKLIIEAKKLVKVCF